MDGGKFDRIFAEGVATLDNRPLVFKKDIEEVVEGLISIIDRAIDGSLPWALPSVHAKP
jgi:hypothetical protein